MIQQLLEQPSAEIRGWIKRCAATVYHKEIDVTSFAVMTDKSKPGRRAPLNVEVTVVIKTGERPEDCITILDDYPVPMVGSIFAYRDQILRFFALSLVRVALSSPAMYREVAPGLVALLDGLRRGKR